MAEKMCNTINQNIEPYTGKIINSYCKQFGTLLDGNDRNDLSHISVPNQWLADDSNISIGAYSDPDVESVDLAVNKSSSLWDRGKIKNESDDDLVCLRRIESSVTNLESFLGSLPHPDLSLTSRHSQSMTILIPSLTMQEDTLSDVDLDKFDVDHARSEENRLESIANGAIVDCAETTSLSDFHNVRDVLLNIRKRLESYLLINQESANDTTNPTNLEGNIAELKQDLERYAQIISVRKEIELKKFSEGMSNHSNIVQVKKAFSRREKLKTNIYETLTSKNVRYDLAINDSLPSTMRFFGDRVHMKDGFTMRNCYDNDYIFQAYSDFSSVEYYTMLINEEKSEKLLNDAPLPRCFERDKISLIFRDPENIIKQWQNYQLKTIQIKPKKRKSMRFSWKKSYKCPPHDVWGFTLDPNQNRALQKKLEKERRLRIACRLFFYFFSFICFVLIVIIVQSLFTLRKHGPLD